MDKELILNKIKELEALLEEDTSLYTDPDTGLMWSMPSESIMTWYNAMKYAENCRDGGFSDWRVPTRAELISLIDETKYDPACKDGLMKSEGYWSSTTCAYNMYYAWGVGFYFGYVSNYYKSDSYYVRCVRTV